jgi:hypothetical protein
MPKRGHRKNHAAFSRRQVRTMAKRQLRERKSNVPCSFCGKEVYEDQEAVMHTETRKFAHRSCAEEHVAAEKAKETESGVET